MRRDQKLDIAIALAAFASSTAVMYLHGFGNAGTDVRDGDALGVALLAVMNLPLAARRAHPLPVFLSAAAAMVGIHALEYPGELGLWPAIAVYSVAAHARDPRAARVGGLVAGALFVILGIIAAVVADPDPGIAFGAVAWAGAWVGGDVSRQRRERIGQLRERAERAERESERERRLAAAEERTLIARELHDSAGHAMNVILVQAGAARLLRDRDGEGAERAIRTIEEVARATIGEIDRLVHALRDDAALADRDVAPLPTTLDLDDLVEQQRAGGLEVQLRRDGDTRKLGTAADRAAYRIVQEALTNAARHGDGKADVYLGYRAKGIEIDVTNPVANAASSNAGGGHGLVDMRERAALLGGVLEVERSDGRFHVHAELPYGDGVA